MAQITKAELIEQATALGVELKGDEKFDALKVLVADAEAKKAAIAAGAELPGPGVGQGGGPVEPVPPVDPVPPVQEASPLPSAPRAFKTELKTEALVAAADKHPDIRAGVCEFCGIVDKNVPPEEQYTKCPHYQGVDVFCTYCGRSDIIKQRLMHIWELKSNPGTLIICCEDYACSKKHEDRFAKK